MSVTLKMSGKAERETVHLLEYLKIQRVGVCVGLVASSDVFSNCNPPSCDPLLSQKCVKNTKGPSRGSVQVVCSVLLYKEYST